MAMDSKFLEDTNTYSPSTGQEETIGWQDAFVELRYAHGEGRLAPGIGFMDICLPDWFSSILTYAGPNQSLIGIK
ncbi:hypothetical protein BU25DRAFT_463215 [Macroventuria anomochaeta]|uniref:Uncharacterized protein n=1 Tax=Macroventuria anomochaeta TaxID=301207 RepID=A0ACB6RJS9_9PLEO|nr:uncharacterized protein BU25DRAFT_463215 [Macroventuria anomochaeta]KAF2622083.1 hypothetical protein BU25DRAFT_463215 [Macroventuria anomochaeta]